jgi:hypothetical protein
MMNLTKHLASQNIRVANATVAQVTQMAREGKFTGDQLVELRELLSQLERAAYAEGHSVCFYEELEENT